MNLENDLNNENFDLPKLDKKFARLVLFFKVIRGLYTFMREVAIILVLIKAFVLLY